jgi:thiol-disulfide isomerase/thioredoxin
MRLRILLSAFVLSITFGSIASAQRSRGLEVGSPAPGLDVEWVKGSFNLNGENVYIVEFWATWCAPCRKSIPHLTKLQEEFGEDGLTVIGISIDQDPDLVEPFVNRQGMKMDYTVGVDNRNRTKRSWMDAAGQKGIPVAFIVDRENIIQFIGHPMDELFDEILVKVMAGRYNLKKQIEAAPSIKAAESYRAGNSWAEASKAYDNAIAIDNMVFAELYIEQFNMLLIDKKDPTAAYKYITKIMLERGAEDSELLTWIARNIAENEDIPVINRKMDFALNTATTALTYARSKTDPKYLSTIAFVHFKNGDIDKAIEWQRKAYFSAREKDKEPYKFDLISYKTQKQHVDAGE